MAGRKISLLVLAVFIVGTFLLIYIQYNASKNISNLIDGNEMMLKEITVNTTLLDLEKEIAAMENIVRETMITNDTALVRGLPVHQQKIASGLAQLQEITKNDSSAVYIHALNGLVQRKLAFSTQVLDSFQVDGRAASRKLLSTGASRRLSDSILQVTQKIDNIREQHLAAIIQLMDRGGKKAQRLGVWLVVLVLVSAAGFLWYIVTIIRKQMSLIKQLDAANRKQQSLIEELDASEKKVREAAKSKERFMAIMAHDIRAPMAGIVRSAELMQEEKLDEEMVVFFKELREGSENMLKIINDYLDLSKMEAGKTEIRRLPFEIRTLLQTVVSMMQPKTEERNLLLLTTVEKTVPDVLIGDAMRLTQILLNLISNAIKFTEQGRISVNVSCIINSDYSATVSITVADTGIGINKEEIPYIFDWFQQTEHTVSKNYGGTGLGLAIVKELVTFQQGKISVESELQKGSTFHIEIPYPIGNYDMLVKYSRIADGETFNDFSDLYILVADDNPINRMTTKHVLEDWKIKVDLAENGKEVVNKLQVASYDLVLMDIEMPVMNGYEATKIIRNELDSPIPIIAMTGHSLGNEREKCASHGMNDFLSKPIDLKELARLIKQYSHSWNRFRPVKRNTARQSTASYTYINLEYMQQVGNGNKEYERSVTEQFLKMMPEELDELEKAQAQNDVPRIQQIVHNMRTTISVMGLNEKLQPFLDQIEYEHLSEEALQSNLQVVKEIGEAALIEAKQFYAELIIAK